jgi:hypothetical protein
MTKSANRLMGGIKERIRDLSARMVVLSHKLAKAKMKRGVSSRRYKRLRKERKHLRKEIDTVVELKHFLEDWI